MTVDERRAVIEIDGVRLVRLLILRRRLQLLMLIILTAIPLLLWFSGTDHPSLSIAAAGSTGLALTLMAAFACTWGRSRERRLASALSPMPRTWALSPLPEASSDDPRASALVELVNRRCRLSPWTSLAVVAAAFCLLFAGMVPSATAASFGHGFEVTVGVDARIDHVERGGKSPVWYLATPHGVVVTSSDGPPYNGERWVVTGRRHPVAYRRGGPDFVELALLAAAGMATAVACTVAGVRRWRDERFRRAGRSSNRKLARSALTALEHEPLEVRIGLLEFRLTGKMAEEPFLTNL